MGPAEIVASLKELCAAEGPKLSTERIVAWIDQVGGFGTNAELIQFAKKMKARQYARRLDYDDAESGTKIKRLWSFHDAARHRRFYIDILELPEAERRRLTREYTRYLTQIRAIRRAMSDYLAGQAFFDFYPGAVEEVEAAAAAVDG